MRNANSKASRVAVCFERLEDRCLLSISPGGIPIPIEDLLVGEGRPGVSESEPTVEGLFGNPVVSWGLQDYRDAIAAAKAADPSADMSGLGDFFRRATADGSIQVYVCVEEITDDVKAALQADGMNRTGRTAGRHVRGPGVGLLRGN